MAEFTQVFNNITVLIISIAGGLSVVMFGYAGIQYVVSQGDPQALSRAKMSVIMSVVGLVVAGMSVLTPLAINRIVVEPVGGRSLVSQAGAHCDQYLKSQLIAHPYAARAETMQELVTAVQATREGCESGVWSPQVNTRDTRAFECFSTAALNETSGAITLSGIVVPPTLDQHDGRIRVKSGRDSYGNILVYWNPDDASKRPSDSANCWLYESRLAAWVEGY